MVTGCEANLGRIIIREASVRKAHARRRYHRQNSYDALPVACIHWESGICYALPFPTSQKNARISRPEDGGQAAAIQISTQATRGAITIITRQTQHILLTNVIEGYNKFIEGKDVPSIRTQSASVPKIVSGGHATYRIPWGDRPT